MIPISPITVDNILPHVGRPVYAVLHDGSCRIGIIRGCSGGHLYLDGAPGGLTLASIKGTKQGDALIKALKANNVKIKGTSARNVKAVKPFKAAKVRTKAWGFGPYGFGGWGWGWGWGAAAAAIGLGAIAALFLLPFFWI